jgi:hypothetical protein
LNAVGRRPSISAHPRAQKDYSKRFARAMAVCIANRLRRTFPDIEPDEEGRGHALPPPTAKAFKRLDVTYTTPEPGLAIGVSVKAINFPDWNRKTRRSTATECPRGAACESLGRPGSDA